MILRCCLVLLVLGNSMTSAYLADTDCKTRVDVLDGQDLSPGLAVFMTEKKIVATAAECALKCYEQDCDVAYFHWNRRECQYTADSSSTSRIHCSQFAARKLDEGVGYSRVQRFCIGCEALKTNKLTSFAKYAPRARPQPSTAFHRSSGAFYSAKKVIIPSRPYQRPVTIQKALSAKHRSYGAFATAANYGTASSYENTNYGPSSPTSEGYEDTGSGSLTSPNYESDDVYGGAQAPGFSASSSSYEPSPVYPSDGGYGMDRQSSAVYRRPGFSRHRVKATAARRRFQSRRKSRFFHRVMKRLRLSNRRVRMMANGIA